MASSGADMSSSSTTAPPGPANIGVDIITIENLKSKTAQWSPTNPNQLYALVDMGSNGIRFSISDLSPPKTRLLPCIYQERAPISLLDALLEIDPNDGSAKDKFPEYTINAVKQTVQRFRTIAVDGYGVPASQMSIFATEAMRRASNAAAMLSAIREAAPDVAVHVLDPRVETLFGAMGARAGLVGARGLFLDLGGGSLQVSYVDSSTVEPGVRVGGPDSAATAATDEDSTLHYGIRAALAGQSLPFGAARMTHVIEHEKNQVLDAEVSSLRAGLTGALAQLKASHPGLMAADISATEPIDLYLYGGGFRGHGSMLLYNDPVQPYPFPTVASYSASASHFADTKTTRRSNRKATGKIPGMSRRRRQQYPAIATVVEALAGSLGGRIGRVTFCAGGNREGALMMSLPHSVREQDPVALLAEVSPAWRPPLAGGPLSKMLAGNSVASADALESVTDCLIAALPESVAELPRRLDVFSLGLAPLFARQIWAGAGRDDADDLHYASEAMHAALARDPGSPGLSHVARAVLAVTLVARFGGAVPAFDAPLLAGLRAIVSSAGGGEGPLAAATGTMGVAALFWADYIGIAAAALTKVVSAWPKQLVDGGNDGGVGAVMRFKAWSTHRLGKENISLGMDVVLPEALAFDTAELTSPFKKLSGRKDGKRIVATAEVVPSFPKGGESSTGDSSAASGA